MGPRRFVAPTAAEALKKIKAELGAEAIVLSNREVPEGIEIVAIEPDALKALAHANATPQVVSVPPRTSEPIRPSLQQPLNRPAPAPSPTKPDGAVPRPVPSKSPRTPAPPRPSLDDEDPFA